MSFLAVSKHSAKHDIFYYVTTEFEYVERDSHPAANGGVVLKRFEFIKVCMGKAEIEVMAEIVIF